METVINQMQTIWPSPAKLNLFLYITGRRSDGYHDLQTLFQFIDYCDTLTITPRQDKQINLLTPINGVANKKNLIIKAAQLLQQHILQKNNQFGLGADISIDKKIPMGGGLGGASSNAATVLVALNKLWQSGLSRNELCQLGITLGADVPIFIYGHAAFAEGIGEKLSPANPPEKWYLIANPGIHISTVDIFTDRDLKRNSPKRTLNELLKQPYHNDCEEIVRKRFDKVEQLVTWLLEYAPTRLTGTGACVFAEFDSKTAAQNVLKNAPECFSCFIARGINISPLQKYSGLT